MHRRHFLAGTCAALLPAPLAAKARATADDTATVAAHNAGLIAQRRDGRSLIYSADYGAMTALLGFLMENCCGGAVCVPAAPCNTKDTTERTAA